MCIYIYIYIYMYRTLATMAALTSVAYQAPASAKRNLQKIVLNSLKVENGNLSVKSYQCETC